MENDANDRYRNALIRYKKAKKELAEINRLISDYKKQIRDDGYYSRSGIKVDMPFLPSTDEKIKIMMNFLGNIENKKVADLGCGDGKILLELARRNADVYGYELEPQLIKKSFKTLRLNGYNCRIYKKSFFDDNLSKYDAITIYGITSIMERLEKKLLDELKPNTLVVTNTFDFPNWEPEKVNNNVCLYIKK